MLELFSTPESFTPTPSYMLFIKFFVSNNLKISCLTCCWFLSILLHFTVSLSLKIFIFSPLALKLSVVYPSLKFISWLSSIVSIHGNENKGKLAKTALPSVIALYQCLSFYFVSALLFQAFLGFAVLLGLNFFFASVIINFFHCANILCLWIEYMFLCWFYHLKVM